MPAARTVATTPQRAQPRLQRACAAGVPAAWVTGESVYGEERPRRRWGEEHEAAPVWAVSGKEEGWRAGQHPQVKTSLATLGAEGGGRLRAGDGTQGPRWYDGRGLPLATPW